MVHGGHHSVIMNSRVIDDNLNRAGNEDLGQGVAGRGAVRDVERDSLCFSTLLDDLRNNDLSAVAMAIRMDANVMPLCRKLQADRRADRPASAGDERALHSGPTRNKTVARPVSNSCASQRMAKA